MGSRAGFQPGVSGNPKGRPKKGQTFTDMILKVGAEKGPDKKTRLEGLARQLFALAEAGDVAAIRHISERIDGKPDVTNRIIEEGLPQVVIQLPKESPGG